LALLPGWLSSHGDSIAAAALFSFFQGLCHQRAERSLMLLGAPAAVCVRCLGIYAGAAFGGLIRAERGLAMSALWIALALNGLDVCSETVGFHGNLPELRAGLGLMLGCALGALLRSPEEGVPGRLRRTRA
jgi:uncharacterized membrane protein